MLKFCRWSIWTLQLLNQPWCLPPSWRRPAYHPAIWLLSLGDMQNISHHLIWSHWSCCNSKLISWRLLDIHLYFLCSWNHTNLCHWDPIPPHILWNWVPLQSSQRWWCCPEESAAWLWFLLALWRIHGTPNLSIRLTTLSSWCSLWIKRSFCWIGHGDLCFLFHLRPHKELGSVCSCLRNSLQDELLGQTPPATAFWSSPSTRRLR